MDKYVLLFLLLTFGGFSMFSQTDISKIRPFPKYFEKEKFDATRQSAIGDDHFMLSISNISRNNNIISLSPLVSYPAFFCKMELKVMNTCNIWIKIHAGDYETYSKFKSP